MKCKELEKKIKFSVCSEELNDILSCIEKLHEDELNQYKEIMNSFIDEIEHGRFNYIMANNFNHKFKRLLKK